MSILLDLKMRTMILFYKKVRQKEFVCLHSNEWKIDGKVQQGSRIADRQLMR
jgi:hypothetical protein